MQTRERVCSPSNTCVLRWLPFIQHCSFSVQFIRVDGFLSVLVSYFQFENCLFNVIAIHFHTHTHSLAPSGRVLFVFMCFYDFVAWIYFLLHAMEMMNGSGSSSHSVDIDDTFIMCKYPYFRLLRHYMPYGNGCTHSRIDKPNKRSSADGKTVRTHRPTGWILRSFTKPVYRRIFLFRRCCCCCWCWLGLNLYWRQQQQRTALSSNSSVYCSIVRGMSSSLWHQLSLSGSLFSVRCKTSFESSLRLLKTSWYEHLCLILIGTIVNDTIRETKRMNTKKTLSISVRTSISSFSILRPLSYVCFYQCLVVFKIQSTAHRMTYAPLYDRTVQLWLTSSVHWNMCVALVQPLLRCLSFINRF